MLVGVNMTRLDVFCMTSGTWLSSVISADSSDDRHIGFKGCYIIDRTYMTADTWISSVISTDSL
jgi:hypothetical protein